MAIVFPVNPSVNDTFTVGSITYKWDSTKWIGLGITPTDRLLEGSNSLEINASNELVWTGGTAKFGGSLEVGANIDLTDSTVDLYSQTTNSASKTFQLFSDIGGTKAEKVSITANGAATLADEIKIQGASTPAGLSSRISKYGSLLIGTSSDAVGDARCSIDSGNGNIATVGAVAATSVNLQSAATSSWFQTGTSLNSVGYVWAAKDSSANVWHSGLQTDGDLYLGGNLTSTNNIGLKGSDGTAFFNGKTTIGTYSVGSEQLRVKGGEADIWLDSQTSGIWRIMGSTGGSTHRFRIYDNTNSRDVFNVHASGSVTKPANPAFCVRHTNSSNAFFANSKATWTNADVNIGSFFDMTNNRFVCPVDGIYYFSCQMLSMNGARLFTHLRRNEVAQSVPGSYTESYDPSTNTYQTNTISIILSCSATETISVWLGTNNGYGSVYANFSGYLVS